MFLIIGFYSSHSTLFGDRRLLSIPTETCKIQTFLSDRPVNSDGVYTPWWARLTLVHYQTVFTSNLLKISISKSYAEPLNWSVSLYI